MIRPLADPEPFMYRCNTLVSTYIVDSTRTGKEAAEMVVSRSPVFHMKVKDGCLYKADPILLKLPDTIQTPTEGIQWMLAHQSENCAEVAYNKRLFSTRSTHALADGGHWVAAFTGLDRPYKRSLPIYIYTNDELFSPLWKSIKSPCSLDINRDGFMLTPSYPALDVAEVIDIHEQVDQRKFACFDRKKQRPVQLTDHSWASLLLAGVIHNWRRTGRIDLSKSGILTLVNLRPWVDRSLDYRCVGNCYSRVLPTGGAFGLDEKVGDLTKRIRASMTRQLKDLEHIKVLKRPLAETVAAPLMVSNPGAAKMPDFCVEGLLQEIVRNVDPKDSSEWAFLLTHAGWAFGDKPQQQFVFSHANKVVLSEEDVVRIQKLTMKGFYSITLDQTIGQALGQLDPAIKSAF
jgi:hypothetical protein